MRAARDAPVDSMGCERCSDPAAPLRDRRFQTLVSLMLSSQTKDPVTFAATKNLIRAGLGTAAALAAASEAEIDAQIAKVGFHNQKSEPQHVPARVRACPPARATDALHPRAQASF
jgi:endonuclease-3